MSRTDAPTRPGAPGWMKLLLILSLAANLAVVGLFAGYNFARDETEKGSWPERLIDRMIAMVPEERQDLAEARFAEVRRQLDAMQGRREAAYADVLVAIRADPYDPKALEAAFDGTLDAGRDKIATVYDGLIALLAELTPAERAAFADRMEARYKRRDSN